MWEAVNKGGTGLTVKKKKKKRFLPRSGTAAKRVGEGMRWGTWVEMGINSTEALKPMGKCSGVSPWLEGGDATSCKKTRCYFWCQEQVGSIQVLPAWCLPLWMPSRRLQEATIVRQEMQRSCIKYLKLLTKKLDKCAIHCCGSVVCLVHFTVFVIN